MFLVYQAGIMVVTRVPTAATRRVLNFKAGIRNSTMKTALLSLAFHPANSNQPLFYVYYTQENSAEQPGPMQDYPYRSVISEMKLSRPAGPGGHESERILLAVPQPFWNHKGGELCFGPMVICISAWATAAASGDPHGNGQNWPPCSPRCCAMT